MPTVRELLAASLKPLLPIKWRIVPVQDNLDVLDRPVVMLKLQTIRKAPSAPLGAHETEFVVTIIDPSVDVATAEVSLDGEVDALLFALDAITGVRWSEANKVKFNDQYLAYDINLTITTGKDA